MGSKNKRQVGKNIGIVILVFSWILSGWPSIWLNPKFPPGPRKAEASHTYDGKSTHTSSAATTITASYTTSPGTTVLVLMLTVAGSTNRAGGAPTFNGVAMSQANSTQKAASAPETSVELWYLVDPPIGTYNVSIPNSGARTIWRVISSYKAQAGYTSVLDVANGGNGTSTNPSVSVTTTAPGDVIVAVVGSGAQTWAPTARSGTQLYDTDNGAYGDGEQYLVQANAGLQAMSWTFGTSEDWAMVVAAFKEVAKTTTLGNGTSEPNNVTVGPGGGSTDLDNFTLQTNASTDTVTALTVTLSPAGAYNNIAQVDITNSSNVAQCTSTTGLGSNTVNLTGCSLAVGTSQTTYKIRVTPKSSGNMPAVPGVSYAVTGTVTNFTSTNSSHPGSDLGSATVTIDNASPGNVTGASGTAGIEAVTLGWTNPGDSDLSQVIVLRRAGLAVSDTPTEGTNYSAGELVGSSTVACVVTAPSTGCNDGNLNGGTAYYYKIFAKDNNGNYSETGVTPGGSPVTPSSLVISVTVTSDGVVNFGTVGAGVSRDTTATGINDTQVVMNDGGVAADFNIKTSNASNGTNWVVGANPGNNIFVHEFSTNGGGNWIKFATADSYQSLISNIGVGGTQNFDLRLTTPSASSDFVEKSVTVTIQAVMH